MFVQKKRCRLLLGAFFALGLSACYYYVGPADVYSTPYYYPGYYSPYYYGGAYGPRYYWGGYRYYHYGGYGGRYYGGGYHRWHH